MNNINGDTKHINNDNRAQIDNGSGRGTQIWNNSAPQVKPHMSRAETASEQRSKHEAQSESYVAQEWTASEPKSAPHIFQPNFPLRALSLSLCALYTQ